MAFLRQNPLQNVLRTCTRKTILQHTHCSYYNFRKAISRNRVTYWSTRCLVGLSSGFSNKSISNNVISRQVQQTLSQCNTSDDVFEALNGIVLGSLTGPELRTLCQHIETITYKDLSKYAWLHSDNHDLSYLQLTFNHLLPQAMEFIINHEKFQETVSAVQDNLNNMDIKDLLECFNCLLLVGLPHTSDLVDLVVDRCCQECPSFDLGELALFVKILRLLNVTYYRAYPLLMNRFVEIFDNSEMTRDHCWKLCMFLYHSTAMASSSLMFKVITKVAEHLSDQQEPTQNIEELKWHLRLLKISHQQRERAETLQQTNKILMQKCQESVLLLADKLQTRDISEVSNAMKSTFCFSAEVAYAIQKRGVELMKNEEDCTIDNLSNLLYAFQKTNYGIHVSDSNIINQITNKIFENIDDADVLILSNLADNWARNIPCTHQGLVLRFQDRIIENIDCILSFVSRMKCVLRYLSRQPFIKKENEEVFKAKLFEALQYKQFGMSTLPLSLIITYLLQTTKGPLPDFLYGKTMKVIPQCRLTGFHNIIQGLPKMVKPYDRKLSNQLYTIKQKINKNVHRFLESSTTFHDQFRLSLSLAVRMQPSDPNLTKTLVEGFYKFSKPFAYDIHLRKTANILRQIGYYDKELMQDMEDYIVKNAESVNILAVSDIMRLYSYVGHSPTRSEELRQIIIDKLEKTELGVLEKVKLFYNCGHLNIMPHYIFKNMFNLEFMEQMDAFLEGSLNNEETTVENLVMDLNRVAVLEYPELDIPWFHEEFCQQKLHNGRELLWGSFTREVKDCLYEVVGGPDYFKSAAFTPYYHLVDYEYVVDGDNKVLAQRNIPYTHSLPGELQRVAVVPLKINNYCYNSTCHLKGNQLVRLKHLEILGYKVITIPQFQWMSVALSDWSAKVDYVRLKTGLT